MLDLLKKKESFLYLSRLTYLFLNSLLAVYLIIIKGPELFGQYSLLTIQIAFFNYIILNGLPNVLQFNISQNEKINSFYFLPSVPAIMLVLIIFNLDELLKLEVFVLILIGSVFQALINIFSVGKHEYVTNLIFTILSNLWIVIVILSDQLLSLNIKEIIHIWGYNSMFIIVISLIYLTIKGFFKNLYFKYDLNGLRNILSNVLIGLPYELFRFTERNFFSTTLSEVAFGVYSFLIYCVSSFQGVFVRPKNQILINQIKDVDSMNLIRSHQKSILLAYMILILPYTIFIIFGIHYYEAIGITYLSILILPFLYNLFYNNSTSYLILINLFSTSSQKAKFSIILLISQGILFGTANIINDINLIAILMVAYFIFFNYISNYFHQKLKPINESS